MFSVPAAKKHINPKYLVPNKPMIITHFTSSWPFLSRFSNKCRLCLLCPVVGCKVSHLANSQLLGREIRIEGSIVSQTIDESQYNYCIPHVQRQGYQSCFPEFSTHTPFIVSIDLSTLTCCSSGLWCIKVRLMSWKCWCSVRTRTVSHVFT